MSTPQSSSSSSSVFTYIQINAQPEKDPYAMPKQWRPQGSRIHSHGRMVTVKQETHGPWFAHLSKTAIAYLQMPCNILPTLPQQLVTEIWQCHKKVKGHPRIIIWINLVESASLMLYTKIQPQSFLGSGEKKIKLFYHIWAWQPILQNFLNKLLVLLRQKAPCEINWFHRTHLKIYTI